MIRKIKNFLNTRWFDDLCWGMFICSLVLLSFHAGTLYERHQLAEATTLSISEQPEVVEAWIAYQEQSKDQAHYFASRNGTKVYPVGCSAGNRIKESNRVFFTTLEHGYTLSDRCK